MADQQPKRVGYQRGATGRSEGKAEKPCCTVNCQLAFLIATTLLVLCVCIVVGIVAGYSLQLQYRETNIVTAEGSGLLDYTKINVNLKGNAALTMTVPNDLTDWISGIEYSYYSVTPYAHR